ncbi:hypothetical protein GSI_11842 [Ganoderma sinense ZZ0214-1]|uniref:Transporter n=1 Tax=Ganoderma sinense ZZ0214-1 TaxID=1077348 RepID=A0A2G8RXP4_9APHY|nr:hypothetical protein GSI_11842 [Ganoderma sinense ZZ0214-1]
MKFASVVVALIAATVAVAAPTSDFEARAAAPSVELNDVDAAAIHYLASRGLLDESSLEARGLLDKLLGKSALKITFHDPTGPVSSATQKQITKQLTKFVTKQQQKDFPFCDVNISEGGKVATATFRCFKTAAKKIGDQGPAGALRL